MYYNIICVTFLIIIDFEVKFSISHLNLGFFILFSARKAICCCASSVCAIRKERKKLLS
uniref:Uncharacterized protein n=1 Tax=Rhizophora mucronata TaxID=61149 RepID=A0A2P2JFF3_RHIMU